MEMVIIRVMKTRLSLLIRRAMYSDDVTTLPAKIMTSIFFIMLCNAMTLTTPFSFIPKLVKSFGTSEVDTGYKVGIIACAMFVGRIGFSIIWGYLCDKYDTKKIAIISAVCLATSSLAFSFSFNFAWTVVTRLLQGASMGLVVITKKLLAEVTDHTNFSLGMSILIGAYSFGVVLGPSLGGFLAFPNELYPASFSKDSIFAKFPVLLPCGIMSIVFYLVVILFWFWVPSRKRVEKHEAIKQEENGTTVSQNSEKLYLLSNSRENLPAYEIRMIKYDSTNSKNKIALNSRKFNFASTKYGKLFRNKTFLSACLVYILSLTLALCFEEAFPLFAATTKEYGGFAFTTVDIGITLVIVAMTTLILQFTFLSRIIEKLGVRKTYLICNIFFAISFPLVPLIHFIHNRKLFWFAMLSVVLLIRLCITLTLITTNMLVNNSVPLNFLGSAMGIAISFSNIARAIGVTSTGAIYGWSLTNVKDIADKNNPLGFPLNQFFVFFIFSVFALVNGICIFITPKSIDKPFVEEICSNTANNEP